MAFTQKQIDEFKALETDAEDSYDNRELAILISKEDHKWASRVFKQSEELAEDSHDLLSLSKSILMTLYGARNPSSIPCFKEYV